MQAVRAFCLFALLALSGCSNAPGPTNSDGKSTPTASETMSNGTISEDVDPVSGRPTNAHWTDCEGFYAGDHWPADTNPGQVPPGWESDATQGTSQVFLVGLRCLRFSWGAIERGPVNMLLEYHNFLVPPEACYEGSPPFQFWFLASWWIEDAAVAEQLAAEEGLPIRASNFTVTYDTDGNTVRTAWSWTTPAGPSSIGLAQLAGPAQQADFIPHRIFWATPAGVSFVQVRYNYSHMGSSEGVVTGSPSESMLDSARPAYAATGATMAGGNHEGSIMRYGDVNCASSAP